MGGRGRGREREGEGGRERECVCICVCVDGFTVECPPPPFTLRLGLMISLGALYSFTLHYITNGLQRLKKVDHHMGRPRIHAKCQHCEQVFPVSGQSHTWQSVPEALLTARSGLKLVLRPVREVVLIIRQRNSFCAQKHVFKCVCEKTFWGSSLYVLCLQEGVSRSLDSLLHNNSCK